MDEETLTEEQVDIEKIIFDIRTFSLAANLFSEEKVAKCIEDAHITIQDGKIVLTPILFFSSTS